MFVDEQHSLRPGRAPRPSETRALRQDPWLHALARGAAMAAKRRKRTGSTSLERIKVVEGIVAELKEHGRAGVKDHDALLVRLVVRTGLSRVQIEEAAIDVVPLLREVAARLRRDEGLTGRS